MNEKQISPTVRENGKRQAEKLNQRRAQTSLDKALKGQTVKVGEQIFKVKRGKFFHSCVQRNCAGCQSPFMIEIAQLNRGRGKFCSNKCNLDKTPMRNRGEANPYWAGGDTKRKQVYRNRYPEKVACRIKTREMIDDGRLVRGLCEVCGTPKTEAHHDDYSKPEQVRWLCKPHHLALHNPKQTTGKWKES